MKHPGIIKDDKCTSRNKKKNLILSNLRLQVDLVFIYIIQNKALNLQIKAGQKGLHGKQLCLQKWGWGKKHFLHTQLLKIYP